MQHYHFYKLLIDDLILNRKQSLTKSYPQCAFHSRCHSTSDYYGRRTSGQHEAGQHRRSDPSPQALLFPHDNPLREKATPPVTWHTKARLITYFILLKKKLLTSKSLVLILSTKWPEKVTNSSYLKYSYVRKDHVLDYSTLFQLLRLTLNGRSLPEW